MNFKKMLQKLKISPVFKQWISENKKFFLAHAFVMLDESNKDVWQIGYYCKDTDKISTFVVEENEVNLIKNQEIFKAEGSIKELKAEDVKLEADEMLKIGKKCREEHYPNEEVFKTFYIIQNSAIGEIYNLTFLTKSFKAINIKISVEDGKILQHSINLLVGKA